MKDTLDNKEKKYTEAEMYEFALDYFEMFCSDYRRCGIVNTKRADRFLAENIKKFDKDK